MKNQHIFYFGPKKNSRYLRRHPEEQGPLTEKTSAKESREAFLDRKAAGKQH
nr:hypothetical protein [uncultured Acetatifactor sp.]